MYNNILNDLRTPVFLINKDNIVDYINSIGEEFFGMSSTLIIGSKQITSFRHLQHADSTIEVELKVSR